MQKKNNPIINLLTNKFIFIGGVTRSGKSFLCPIISSFKKTEMFIVNSIAENIYYLNFLKLIDEKSASYLFKHIYNEKIYNFNIGRDLNWRNFDYSSITKYKKPRMYDQRQKSKKEGDIKIKDIRDEKHNYPIMFHDVLIDPKFIFKSFPKSKIIFIDRDPIDLIYEWKTKKYYGQFYSNPRNTTLSFKYNNKLFYPYWCKGHEHQFSKLNNVYEKTIFLLDILYSTQKKNYIKYKKKFNKNMLIVNFQKLTEKTFTEINIIEKFINLKKSKFTNLEIKKQNGNRKYIESLRQKKKNEILNNVSNKFKKRLIHLEELYFKK